MTSLLKSHFSGEHEIPDWTQPKVFLDQAVDLTLTGNGVAIQSFQGAGNDLLGELVAQVTGVFTGSDQNIYSSFDR